MNEMNGQVSRISELSPVRPRLREEFIKFASVLIKYIFKRQVTHNLALAWL